MDEKQSTRDAWRRRQALTRRHGGRGRGRGRGQPGQQKPPGRRGRGGLGGLGGQPAGAGHVVPDQRDRYKDADGMDDAQGPREDYAEWLSTSAKDSRELLRRQRVALPDVHEFTRFVLETRHAGSMEEDVAAVDESLDLGAIGACLRRLPIEVMLAVQGSEVFARELVRQIEAGDAFARGDLDDVGEAAEEEKAGEEETAGGETREEKAAPAADLAAELDAFLGLDDRGGTSDSVNVDTSVDKICGSTLEDDLAWFDQL
jgi:hypothetical protein